jgi:hypothetical protein
MPFDPHAMIGKGQSQGGAGQKVTHSGKLQQRPSHAISFICKPITLTADPQP